MAGNRRCEDLAEVACLRRIGFLHLVQQQLPRLVIRLEFALVAFRLGERVDRIAQALACDGASNLFEATLGPLDLSVDRLQVSSRSGERSLGSYDFGGSHRPGRDGQAREPF
jgi:hypothetical protein